ncbi:DUF6316 family protein [Marinobacter zhejiangensis]|uniref:DUF6316 domain-containing protein n=1 Tax=Marinobacter zhejiangensis TaxID=488535 RepID=A0A1I4LVQ8_9GAMM|nr:hypothetical protein SAMN04487963_0687 [Marinobacter zhejiangensis]
MTVDALPLSHNSNRFLKTIVGWYALTREPYDLGPFPTRREADEALVRHIRVHRGINTRSAIPGNPEVYVHDSTSCAKQNCGRCAEVLGLFLWPPQAC